MMWKRKILIIVCALVAATFSFIKVTYFTADTYTANGILYVRNRDQKSVQMDQSDEVYGSDINTSRLLSTTYIEILSTRSFLTDVSNSLGGKYSWGQVRGMMSISAVNDTELLNVVVSSGSAQDACDIANAIMENANDKLKEIFNGGDVEIVDRAVAPAGPNGKNRSRTVLIALLAGLAIGCAAAFVLDYFDTIVHKSADVAKRYQISILGEISQ